MGRDNRYKEIQLVQLRSFIRMAAEGNFTAAAKALGISVPAVWQQVRALEQKLGASLIRRCGRDMEVTSEGRLLLELVNPHVSGLDSLERLFALRRAELPQDLHIAATYYLLSYHLPPALQTFAARYPAARLHLRASIWPRIIRRVERGVADIGVVSYSPDQPRSSYLEYEPLFDLHFMLMTAADHPLARKQRVTPEDLVRYPLIVSKQETFSQKMLERILRRHGVADRTHRVLESPTTEFTCRYVALGLGIALSYIGRAAGRLMPGLALRVFDPSLEVLPVYLVVRKGAHLSPPVEEFRAIVRRTLARRTRSNEN